MNRNLISGLVAVAVAAAIQAFAGDLVEIETIAEVEIEVVNQEGETEIRRVTAEKVVPGDEVVYTIVYRNVGDEPAEALVITNPIPEHMAFSRLSEREGSDRILFSVDGGTTYDHPENLRIVEADGTVRAARPSDYTHVRWSVERLLPLATGRVSYRARLL